MGDPRLSRPQCEVRDEEIVISSRSTSEGKDFQSLAERAILATKHDATPASADARVLVDIDLSILASDAIRFDEYEMARRAACGDLSC